MHILDMTSFNKFQENKYKILSSNLVSKPVKKFTIYGSFFKNSLAKQLHSMVCLHIAHLITWLLTNFSLALSKAFFYDQTAKDSTTTTLQHHFTLFLKVLFFFGILLAKCLNNVWGQSINVCYKSVFQASGIFLV